MAVEENTPVFLNSAIGFFFPICYTQIRMTKPPKDNDSEDGYKDNPGESARDSGAHPPFRFIDGLIEIPFHGLTDRAFLDNIVADDEALTMLSINPISLYE